MAGNLVSMVSYEKLSVLMNRPVRTNALIEKEMNIFEGGMLDVLKDVAAWQLDNKRYEVQESEFAGPARESAAKIYEALEATLTPEQKKLFIDFEEAYTYQASIECDDNFMSGFIHGYAYLKHLTKKMKKAPL